MMKATLSDKREREKLMTSKTVVIPAGVDEIVEDAIPDCGRVDKLYLKVVLLLTGCLDMPTGIV